MSVRRCYQNSALIVQEDHIAIDDIWGNELRKCQLKDGETSCSL